MDESLKEISEVERAYRRGALQAIEWLTADLRTVPEERLRSRIAAWLVALRTVRTSANVRWLGNLLDEVEKDLR